MSYFCGIVGAFAIVILLLMALLQSSFSVSGKDYSFVPGECLREHAIVLLAEPYRYQEFSATTKWQTHVPPVVQVSVI